MKCPTVLWKAGPSDQALHKKLGYCVGKSRLWVVKPPPTGKDSCIRADGNKAGHIAQRQGTILVFYRPFHFPTTAPKEQSFGHCFLKITASNCSLRAIALLRVCIFCLCCLLELECKLQWSRGIVSFLHCWIPSIYRSNQSYSGDNKYLLHE